MALLSFNIESNRRVFRNPAPNILPGLLPGQFRGGFTSFPQRAGLFDSMARRDEQQRAGVARQVQSAFGGGPRGGGLEGATLKVQQATLRATLTTQSLIQRNFTISNRYFSAAYPAIKTTEKYQTNSLFTQREQVRSLTRIAKLLSVLPTGGGFGKGKMPLIPLGKLIPEDAKLLSTRIGDTIKAIFTRDSTKPYGFLRNALSLVTGPLSGLASLGKGAIGAVGSIGSAVGPYAPAIGLTAGIGNAISRFQKGNYLGALTGAVSGIASITPRMGPLVSVAIESLAKYIPDNIREAFNTQAPKIVETLGEWIYKGFEWLVGKDTAKEYDKKWKEIKSDLFDKTQNTFVGHIIAFTEHIGSLFDELLINSEKKDKPYTARLVSAVEEHVLKPLENTIKEMVVNFPEYLYNTIKESHPTLANLIAGTSIAARFGGTVLGTVGKGIGEGAAAVTEGPIPTEHPAQKRYAQMRKRLSAGMVSPNPFGKTTLEDYRDAAVEFLRVRRADLDPKSEEAKLLTNKINALKNRNLSLYSTEEVIQYVESSLPEPGQKPTRLKIDTTKPAPTTPTVSPAPLASTTPVSPITKSPAGNLSKDVMDYFARSEGADYASITPQAPGASSSFFGKYQFTHGTMQNFLEYLGKTAHGAYGKLTSAAKGAGGLASSAFKSAWKSLAPSTAEAQEKFTREAYAEPAIRDLQTLTGIDEIPLPVQQIVVSTYGQSGAGAGKTLIQKAWQSANGNWVNFLDALRPLRDEDILRQTQGRTATQTRHMQETEWAKSGLAGKVTAIVDKAKETTAAAVSGLAGGITGFLSNLFSGIGGKTGPAGMLGGLGEKLSAGLGPTGNILETFLSGKIPNFQDPQILKALGLTGPIAEGIETDISGMVNQVITDTNEQIATLQNVFREAYMESPVQQEMLQTAKMSEQHQRAMANKAGAEIEAMFSTLKDAYVEQVASFENTILQR